MNTNSVPCNQVLQESDLLNPGDYLILQPNPAWKPWEQQMRVILPSGQLELIDIAQGVSGNRGWNGSTDLPILYAQIVTFNWVGWIDVENGVSRLRSAS
jgi:hypothetical protein